MFVLVQYFYNAINNNSFSFLKTFAFAIRRQKFYLLNLFHGAILCACKHLVILS